MSVPREPFRVLSNEEFAQLTTAERADYIRRAVEALDILRAQMNAEVMKSINKSENAWSLDPENARSLDRSSN